MIKPVEGPLDPDVTYPALGPKGYPSRQKNEQWLAWLDQYPGPEHLVMLMPKEMLRTLLKRCPDLFEDTPPEISQSNLTKVRP